jgi:hypothetical protein
MVGHEAAGAVIIDQRIVGEPSDGATLGAGIAERVPRRQQVRILSVQLIFEAAESALALDGPREPASGPFIGDGFGEVGHVLVPDPSGQRVDADQIQLIEVDRRLAVDAGVGRPERDLSGLRVDHPPMLVAVLVGQRDADLLQVQAGEVKHQARIVPFASPALTE